jgi:hypothetical protein
LRNALTSTLRHALVADANCGLLVLIPFVLRIGPLPDVLGVGTLRPFWRRHVANCPSAALKADFWIAGGAGRRLGLANALKGGLT